MIMKCEFIARSVGTTEKTVDEHVDHLQVSWDRSFVMVPLDREAALLIFGRLK